MIERLNVPVSVGVVFDHRTRESRINRVTYDGRVYIIRRVTYHFPKRQGRTFLHTFCVEGEGVFFESCPGLFCSRLARRLFCLSVRLGNMGLDRTCLPVGRNHRAEHAALPRECTALGPLQIGIGNSRLP